MLYCDQIQCITKCLNSHVPVLRSFVLKMATVQIYVNAQGFKNSCFSLVINLFKNKIIITWLQRRPSH